MAIHRVGALVQGSDCNFYGATKHSRLSGFELYGTVFTHNPEWHPDHAAHLR